MKNYIFSALIALCSVMPLMGVTVRNTTENNAYLTATLPGQTTSTTVTMQPHSRELIDLKQSVPRMDVIVGALVPAHKQMTPIEPIKGARGWLFIGRDQEGHELYVPLLPRTENEKSLEGARASYAVIDGQITRVDSFAQATNIAQKDTYTLSPASYAKDIDAKSYIMVVRDQKLIAKLYAPQVVRNASTQWYKNKNK
jgi:hypothetical protein